MHQALISRAICAAAFLLLAHGSAGAQTGPAPYPEVDPPPRLKKPIASDKASASGTEWMLFDKKLKIESDGSRKYPVVDPPPPKQPKKKLAAPLDSASDGALRVPAK
jgi:hypothetical protein